MALYTGIVTTFRILGNAATAHTLFSLENTSGSARIITVRRLTVQLDATALLTAVMPQVKCSRSSTMPGGGTTLTKGTFDTSQSSVANVVVRGANASDGGAATAITGTLGTIQWQQFCMRMHSVVGQVLAPDNNVLPALIDNPSNPSFLIQANQAIYVHVVAAAGTSNPATNHWFVSCVWEEN
jgi:hypothetical protein